MLAFFEQKFYLPENCQFTKFVTFHFTLNLQRTKTHLHQHDSKEKKCKKHKPGYGNIALSAALNFGINFLFNKNTAFIRYKQVLVQNAI